MNSSQLTTGHNHAQCIDKALSAAEKICLEKKLRLTPLRKRILELIWSNHKSIGAYELLDVFKQEDPNAKPVTIYRALDFLLSAGLIHKVESINAFVGCLRPETTHHSVILICDSCHNTYEVEAQKIYQQIIEASKLIDFSPSQLTLELHGCCSNCQSR